MLEGAHLARDLSPAFGHRLTYAAVPPDVFERNLAPHLGPAVARGIAASYFWLADHADTPLLMGTDSQLQDELSRPATSLARWARSQAWPALTAEIGLTSNRHNIGLIAKRACTYGHCGVTHG